MIFQRLQVILLIAVVVIGIAYAYTSATGKPLSSFFVSEFDVIHIGEVPIHVEIATTKAARERGLSGRPDLDGESGLLMVFDEPGYHGIWMKDMRFAIDVVWISKDLKVVDIARGLTPDSYPQIYEPKEPALYVLETKRLFTDTFGINVGDRVYIPEVVSLHK